MSKTPWAVRYRYFVLVGWCVLLLAAAPLALHVTHHLSSRGFSAPGSSSVWADTQQSKLRMPPSTPPQLIQGLPRASVDRIARAEGIPDAWFHAVQGAGTLLLPPTNTSAKTFSPFLARVRSAGGQVSAVTDASVGHELVHDSVTTLRTSSSFALPVLVILLLLVFGSVASAALPFLIALVGSVLALGAVDLLENVLTLSTYLTDIVSFLALGVGVDYALFIDTRFRQAMARGVPVPEAVHEAMASAGRSVFFSGLAVTLAMSALVIGGTSYWTGLAVGGAVAVVAVLIATHTLLPALLSILGRRVDWGRLPRPFTFSGFWPALARFGTHRPGIAIATGGLILLIPAVFGPGLQMRIPANLAAMLPPSSPLRQATAVEERLAGAGHLSPFVVAIHYQTGVKDAATWRNVATITSAFSKLPQVASVGSPTRLGLSPLTLSSLYRDPSVAPPQVLASLAAFTNPGRDAHLVVLYVTPRSGPDTPETTALLASLRKTLRSLAPPGSRSGVGGSVALLHDFDHYVGVRLPWIIAAVAFVAFAVLFAATGALWQALLGVAVDGLVALATAGLLVLTIQRGSLGLSPAPPNTGVTPLIFVLLFGLSMDYEVILLHRIQEALRYGYPVREAARRGIEVTGGMITGAGLIMIVVFVALVLSPLEILQTLGIGMTAAILLDTWIVRTFLVPGITTLLGRFAFWPRGGGRESPARGTP